MGGLRLVTKAKSHKKQLKITAHSKERAFFIFRIYPIEAFL
jgi:hypothetical protein